MISRTDSRSLTSSEKKWHSSELECAAIVWALERWRKYIEGKPCTVITDNQALCYLFSKPKTTARLERWILRIQDFQFKVKHIKGKDNVVADALSRSTETPTNEPADGIVANPAEKASYRSNSNISSDEEDTCSAASKASKAYYNKTRRDVNNHLDQRHQTWNKDINRQLHGDGRAHHTDHPLPTNEGIQHQLTKPQPLATAR